jgi:hypothetical protein
MLGPSGRAQRCSMSLLREVNFKCCVSSDRSDRDNNQISSFSAASSRQPIWVGCKAHLRSVVVIVVVAVAGAATKESVCYWQAPLSDCSSSHSSVLRQLANDFVSSVACRVYSTYDRSNSNTVAHAHAHAQDFFIIMMQMPPMDGVPIAQHASVDQLG